MNGLAFYGGHLVITPGPDADREQVEEFKASMLNYLRGGKSDAVLAAAVELAALCEKLFNNQEAKWHPNNELNIS